MRQPLPWECTYLPPQRARAAFRAIAFRLGAESAFARAFPPLRPPSRPRATAAASLPLSFVISSVCPVAIRMTWTAAPITSAGLRWPFGPLGIPLGWGQYFLRQAGRDFKLRHYRLFHVERSGGPERFARIRSRSRFK